VGHYSEYSLKNSHRIWKYDLAALDLQTIELPRGARVLSVDAQGGNTVLWALVNPDEDMTERTFRICGTGHPVCPDPGTFIGTVLMAEGGLVWHVFEVTQ